MKKNITLKSLLLLALCVVNSGVIGQVNNARLAEILFKQTGRDVRTINTSANQVGNLFRGVSQVGKLQNTAINVLKNPQFNTVYGLDVNAAILNNLVSNRPANLRLSIPIAENRDILLDLVKVNIGEFKVRNSLGNIVNSQNQSAVHYQGIFSNDPNSIAAISMYADGTVMGVMSSKGLGNRIIGKSNGTSSSHVIYDVADLKLSKEFAFTCGVNDTENKGSKENVQEIFNNANANSTCKEVKVYFECDNALYQSQGSTIQGTVQYMSGIFNQVKTIYANESVNMIISEIKVWDTIDPYVNIFSTSQLVSTFQSTLNGNYNGDIAHFISGRINQLGGGIANGIPPNICAFGKANMCCVSAIETTYQPLPTYSWTVNVITHEMGHILGSRHTHYCGWVGGAIDGCSGFAESDSSGNSCPTGPIPSIGGTTMSYCHQQSVGVNMTLGFGPQPGNMIRNKIAISSCITSSASTPDPTNLQVLAVTGTTSQVQWASVVGAGYYAIEYRATGSGAWLFAGTSNTNAYVLNGLNFNTTYEWRVRTSCSNFVQGNNFSTQPAEITINASQVPINLCINSSFAVNFTVAGTINTNNVFSLKLINSSNNVIATIGTLSGTTSSSIQATISNTIPSGTYKLRVDATSPIVTSLLSTQSFVVSSVVADVPPSIAYGNVTTNAVTIQTQAITSGFTLYYVFVNQGTIAPTSQQIASGKSSNNAPGIKSGQIVITNPNQTYSKIVSGLLQGSNYDIYITFSNSINNCPAPVLKQSFVTSGNPLTYCTPSLYCDESNHIALFQILSIGLNRTSGCDNGNGAYTFLSDNAYNIPIGQTVDFTLKTGYYGQKASIWIDTDHDGVFSNSELVYSNNNYLTTHTGNIAISPTALPGLTRMRVIVSYDISNPSPCIQLNYYGEIEDYLVDLGCNNILAAPTNLQVSTIKANKATVSWTAVNGALGYSVRYKPSNTVSWDSIRSTTGTSYTLVNLRPNTTYNWEVSANCSPFTAGTNITTLIGEIQLIPPSNLNFCKGSSFNLAYKSVLNNTVTTLVAQLSNSSGSFTNPQTIGSTNNILPNGGGITCFLDNNIASGNYKIRFKTVPNLLVSDTLQIAISNQSVKSVTMAEAAKVSNGNYKFKFKASNRGKIYFVVTTLWYSLPTYQQVLAGKDYYNSAAFLADSVSISDSSQFYSVIKKFTYQGYYGLYAVIKDNNSTCGQNVTQTIFFQATGGSPGSGAYCSPQMYCEPNYYISNFKISNSTLDLQKTTGCGTYTPYITTTHNLAMATPYTITVTSPSLVYLTIWIDKNNNNLFENSEILVQSTSTSTTYSVPLSTSLNNILEGRYRMRAVIRVYGTVYDPCLTGYYGEALDFIVSFGNPNCWDSPYATLVSPLDDIGQSENLSRSAQSFDAANKVNATGQLSLNYKDVIDLTPGFDSKNTSVFSISRLNCPTLTTNNITTKPDLPKEK